MLSVYYDTTEIPAAEEEIAQLRDEYNGIQEGYITIVTDGACSGNPGPAGYAGCLIQPNGDTVYIKFFEGKLEGDATNNQAELQAIGAGCAELKSPQKVIFITDSQYAIGILTGVYKRKMNLELIEKVEKQMDTTTTRLWRKVPGHGNCKLMNIIDKLAVHQAGSKGK